MNKSIMEERYKYMEEKDNKDLKELRKDAEKEQVKKYGELIKAVDEYVESISVPTGVNFWDYM